MTEAHKKREGENEYLVIWRIREIRRSIRRFQMISVLVRPFSFTFWPIGYPAWNGISYTSLIKHGCAHSIATGWFFWTDTKEPNMDVDRRVDRDLIKVNMPKSRLDAVLKRSGWLETVSYGCKECLKKPLKPLATVSSPPILLGTDHFVYISLQISASLSRWKHWT